MRLYLLIALVFILPLYGLSSGEFVKGHIITKGVTFKNKPNKSTNSKTIECFIENLEYHHGHHYQVRYRLNENAKTEIMSLMNVMELRVGETLYNTIFYVPKKRHHKIANTFAKMVQDGHMKLYQGLMHETKARGFNGKVTYYLVKDLKYTFDGSDFDKVREVGVYALDEYYDSHHYRQHTELFFSDYPELWQKIKSGSTASFGHGLSFAKAILKEYNEWVEKRK